MNYQLPILGKTLKDIKVSYDHYLADNDAIYFLTTDDELYVMTHSQDCCESVNIDDIVGDINDLIGTPITMAEESCQPGNEDEDSYESSTWTFYRFATIKGYVTVKWYGTSNGYYSETAEFFQVSKPENDYYGWHSLNYNEIINKYFKDNE